jgi:hypothetical protein
VSGAGCELKPHGVQIVSLLFFFVVLVVNEVQLDSIACFVVAHEKEADREIGVKCQNLNKICLKTLAISVSKQQKEHTTKGLNVLCMYSWRNRIS